MRTRVGEVGRAFLLGFVPTLMLTAATAAGAAGWNSNTAKSASFGMASFNHSFTAVSPGTGGATYVSPSTYMGTTPLFYFNLQNTSTQPAAMTGVVQGTVTGLDLIPAITVKTCTVPWVANACSTGAVVLVNAILGTTSGVTWGTQPVGGTIYVQVGMGTALANVVVTATSTEVKVRSGIDRTAG